MLVLAVVAAGGDVSRLETRQAASIRAASTTTTRAVTPSCGRPENAPGFGTPARSGVVPDTRCMDLQLAQDKAEAAGFFRLAAQDATGRGRHPLWDRNWVVISQTPAPGTRTPQGTRIVFRVLHYGDAGAPPTPDRARPGPLPNLHCFDLQEAEDTLQSAGFTRTASRDATGRGRHQILDRDWTVTGQTPVSGGPYPKSTRIELDVVKDSEASSCRP